MTYSLKVTEAAAKDIELAATWYEDRKEGLGYEFLTIIRESLRSIEREPLHFPYADPNKQRRKYILPKPFQLYLIIYQVHEGNILIVAVFHTKRNPNIWKSR